MAAYWEIAPHSAYDMFSKSLVGEPNSRMLQNDRKIAPERPTSEFLYTCRLDSA